MPQHSHTDGTLAMASHTHGVSIQSGTESADHTHAYTVPGGAASFTVGSGASISRAVGSPGAASTGFRSAAHSHGVNGNTGGPSSLDVTGATGNAGTAPGQAALNHENLPPYVAVNFIIRAG
jgi:hypothetical protein